jgi:hypothetical protein
MPRDIALLVASEARQYGLNKLGYCIPPARWFRRINFLKAKSVMLSTFLKLMLSHA